MRCYFKGTTRDGVGQIIPSATVSVFLAGTTTAASIYASLTSTTAVNSVTSSSDGTFEFYISRFDYNNDQQFKLVIAKTGYTTNTWDYTTIDNIVLTTYAISVDTTVITNLGYVPKGVIFQIATGKTLTFSGVGTFSAGLYQIFSCVGTGAVSLGAYSIREAYPEWWGAIGDDATDSTNAINAALLAHRLVKGVPGSTYKTTVAGLLMSVAKTIFDFNGATVKPSTYTTSTINYTIKVTAADCVIKNGYITSPAFTGNQHLFTGSAANFQKGIIWGTAGASRLTVDNMTFTNIPWLAIYMGVNVSGAVNIKNNHFNGGYTDYTYVLGEGFNHYAFLSDGLTFLNFENNYIEYCVQAVGNATYTGAGATDWEVHNNTFYYIWNHPYYIYDGARCIITNNKEQRVAGGIALYGNYHVYANNEIYLYSSMTGFPQSGLAFRDASYSVVSNNTITGNGDSVILGFENLGDTSLIGNIIVGNTINCSNAGVVGGVTYGAYQAIRIGTTATTTDNSYNIISNNYIYTDILATYGTTGIIGLYSKALGETAYNKVIDNTIKMHVNSDYGILVNYGSHNDIKRNTFFFGTTPSGAQNLDPIVLASCSYENVIDNEINVIPTTKITLTAITESTAASYNRYIDNRVYSGTTGSNNVSFSLQSSSSAMVKNNYNHEVYVTNTAAVFSLKFGHVFILTATGGNRNFNPSDTFPPNYQIDVYNTDAANTITFDSTGLNCAIAAAKHGIFIYTGAAWKGSQID